MTKNIRIIELDHINFVNLAERMTSVRTYAKGKNWQSSSRQVLQSMESQKLLKIEFPFLIDLVYNNSSFVFSSKSAANKDTFACAVSCDELNERLVGFTSIKHFPAQNLYPELIEHLEERGNTSLRQIGYDCTTVTSIDLGYRGLGISERLRRASADICIARHRARGGEGPALMKLSSFEPMGLERLVNGVRRVASERDDIVIGFGNNDIEQFGIWADKTDIDDLSRSHQYSMV